MKTWQTHFKIGWLFLIFISFLIIGVEAAEGGVIDFFFRIIVRIGDFILDTPPGTFLVNAVDWAASKIDSHSVQPDTWGALTGTYIGPTDSLSFEFKSPDGMFSSSCQPPVPAKMIRDSVRSPWFFDPEMLRKLEYCQEVFARAMKQLSS